MYRVNPTAQITAPYQNHNSAAARQRHQVFLGPDDGVGVNDRRRDDGGLEEGHNSAGNRRIAARINGGKANSISPPLLLRRGFDLRVFVFI